MKKQIVFIFFFSVLVQNSLNGQNLFVYPFIGEFEVPENFPKKYFFKLGEYDAVLSIKNILGRAKLRVYDSDGKLVLKGKYKGDKRVFKRIYLVVDPDTYETANDTILVVYPNAQGRWKIRDFNLSKHFNDHIIPANGGR